MPSVRIAMRQDLPYLVTNRRNRGSIVFHSTANVEYSGVACRQRMHSKEGFR
jgi:hypothetical protein